MWEGVFRLRGEDHGVPVSTPVASGGAERGLLASQRAGLPVMAG